MNIAEIVKKCPKGTTLYSPLIGELELIGVDYNRNNPILCIPLEAKSTLPCYLSETIGFTEEGRYSRDYPHAECMLFPSKDQRDWSKFVVSGKESDQSHQFKPFDKVLVRDNDDSKWVCDFFERIPTSGEYEYSSVLRGLVHQCIPYEGNEHLLGTTNKPE